MEDKEIIIDGKKEKVNILFECNHIDDLQAYEMIKNGIEITPENAPICNFKIKIVSNKKSPYGFYTIFQKDPKKDEWEYMGTGNSGASSLITALLKIHKMGLKRILDLEERVIKHSAVVEEYCSRLADKDQECEELKKEQLEIKKYLGISHKSILERLEELQVRRDELSEKNLSYEQALNEIEYQLTELYIGAENKDRKYCEKIKDIINKTKENNQWQMNV